MRKQQLNLRLYRLHLILANTWDNTWHYTQHTINGKLDRIAHAKYQALNHKLHSLTKEQTITPRVHHSFYPRVVNNTDITFSNKEAELLEKAPKYNLHHKKKHWLTNFTLEAETAIYMLPVTDQDYFRNQVSDHLQKI
jgi:cobalamin-dependent methionine synthase I